MNDRAPDHGSLPDTDAMPASVDEWKQYARCRGVTHMMFPAGHKDITYISPAREICAACPVTEQCLDYALSFPAGDMHGVWAGMTPRQLAAEQRRRKIRPTKPTLAEMWAHLKST